VIAPWREWDLNSRAKLIDYAEKHGIDIPRGKRNAPPYSMDANLLHTSYEGEILEDPWTQPDEEMFLRSVSPEKAPDQPETIEVEFEQGDAVAINGQRLSPAALLTRLNELGGKHGVGRLDLVENRFVGMKSRGIYETPGGTVLLAAHRGIESITLDRGASHLKDELMPRYAELIYNGFWFSPERRMLQALIDESQKPVSGTVKLKLYKGQASVIGRQSVFSLYSKAHATFDADTVYDQKDAEGFIKLNALRLKLVSKQQEKLSATPAGAAKRAKLA
jgi:argininosuccinate synthase